MHCSTLLQRGTALRNIASVVEEMREKDMLPAICFNEDRRMCEKLAEELFSYLERKQIEFESSSAFKNKYEIRDEKVSFLNYVVPCHFRLDPTER